MIAEYLLKKTLDASFNLGKEVAKGFLAKKNSKLLTTRESIEESLYFHLISVQNWSEEVSFSDLKKAKFTTDIYIELDLYVYPRRLRIQPSEKIKDIPIRNIFNENNCHIVLLGQPGAGKTTSVKFLCQLLIHDENFLKDKFNFPILIKFRDLNKLETTENSSFLINEIYKILGLKVELSEELQGNNKKTLEAINDLKENLVVNFLNKFNVLLILEGFDEFINANYREKVIDEIRSLAVKLSDCKMLITSRTGDFRYSFERTNEFEICSLNEKQVKTFANKWIQNTRKANDFIDKLYKSPFADTAIRPITLAHLCAIYERIEDIPEKPKTIYKKIVNLLLEEWDQQRSIKRISRYANFEIDRKYEFLSHLAYIVTEGLRQTVFTERDLLYVYKTIREEYGLSQGEAKQVVSELETHTGLFLQSGYEEYEFAHKSLQEFLTAEYLVRLPSIPSDFETITALPNEFAIAVAISSSPTSYFNELVYKYLKKIKHSRFLLPFINRLLIEKPDFKATLALEIALLTLYSNFLEERIKFDDEDENYFDERDNYTELSLSFDNIIKKHHTELINEYLKNYKIESFYKSMKEGKIFNIKLPIGRVHHVFNPLNNKLPQFNKLFDAFGKDFLQRSYYIKESYLKRNNIELL